MKVVFLDFDGVINSGPFTDALKQKQDLNIQPPKLSMKWWAAGIDPDAVVLLNGLLNRTGSKVVVSSTWRLGTDRSWLQCVLEMCGFEGEVIGVTERFPGKDRRIEIQDWIDRHSVENFVILDDNGGAWIHRHFVQTDFEVGLTDELVEKAVKVLSRCDRQPAQGPGL